MDGRISNEELAEAIRRACIQAGYPEATAKRRAQGFVEQIVRPPVEPRASHAGRHEKGPAVIVTNDLTKTYGSNTANDSINLSIAKGEIYGLVGRNGAGKTTLMRQLLGLTRPSSGSIELLGMSGAQLDDARRHIGCIIETPAFYQKLTARQNLLIRARLIGLAHSGDAISETFERVGLTGKENRKVEEYSLGMRQSLGIAAAILGNPELLILDEPTNGLDPVAIASARNIFLDLNEKRGTTILISSHILGELERLTSRYGFIVRGKLVHEISSEEVEASGVDLENLFIKMAGDEA